MKVVFICKDFKESNVRNQPWAHIYHLVNEFRKVGISCGVVSYGTDVAGREEDVKSVRVHRVKGRMSISLDQCVRKVMELDPDVVNWFSGLVSSYVITKFTSATHSPTVWNITQRRISFNEVAGLGIRDAWKPKELAVVYSYSLLPNYFIRAAARSVRGMVVSTSRARASIIRMGVPDNKVYQITSGIDTDLFSQLPSRSDIDEIRERIGFNRNDFVLCYFGPASTLRGFDTALEAFSILKTKVVNARLLILARQEPDKKPSTSAGQSTGVSLVTEDLKPRQVSNYLMASDAVVLPFKFWPADECPLTILEAMASGTPVVTTPIPLVEDVIVNGVNGFVVPAENPHALSQLVETLAKDEDKGIAVGSNARQFMLANYDWSSVAKKTLELFLHLKTLNETRPLQQV